MRFSVKSRRLRCVAFAIALGPTAASAQPSAATAGGSAPVTDVSATDGLVIEAPLPEPIKLEPIEIEPAERPPAARPPAIEHASPWWGFPPGAWRRLRTVSEAFGPAGEPAGSCVTEVTERLAGRDADSYELEVESVVDLAGRRSSSPTERRHLWFATDRPIEWGEPRPDAAEVTTVSVGPEAAPCRVWALKQPVPGGVEEESVYLSEDAVPVILRRERRSTLPDAPGGREAETIERVTRRGTPIPFGGTLVPGWEVETAVSHPSGDRTESCSTRSHDAPGGLHRESITDYDARGVRTRWAVTELVAWGAEPDQTVEEGASPGPQPAVSIEVRSRRFLRLIRRSERAAGR